MKTMFLAVWIAKNLEIFLQMWQQKSFFERPLKFSRMGSDHA
jgi:hypothetical protein